MVKFKNFIQSPIGLVPKSGGKTRLIFHLSYNFPDSHYSINHYTPAEKCTVKYNDIDFAVISSFKWGYPGHCFYGKTDVQSAFRVLPLSPECFYLLLMKAESPLNGQTYWFVEKNLPFGHSISCSHFQRFSNAVKHIFEHRMGRRLMVTNYLDDFLFTANSRSLCNHLVRSFLLLCNEVGIPISQEKTEWARSNITFLGILLDGNTFTLCVPEEKRIRTVNILNLMIQKRKATVKEIQSLCELLNFLARAVVPGRTFTRRMYTKYSKITDKKGRVLKQHHHINLDDKFKNDCRIWLDFLTKSELLHAVARPFIDLSNSITAETVNFYSDASAAEKLGFGIIFNNSWTGRMISSRLTIPA